jgi:hypothetical protein
MRRKGGAARKHEQKQLDSWQSAAGAFILLFTIQLHNTLTSQSYYRYSYLMLFLYHHKNVCAKL